MENEYLKQILVTNSGILREDEFESFSKLAESLGIAPEQLLVKRGIISESYFLSLLGDYYKVPFIDLRPSVIDLNALNQSSEKYAANNMLIPFAFDGKILKIAMADPSNTAAIEPFRSQGLQVEVYVATKRAIKRALILYRGTIEDRLKEMVAKVETAVNKKGGKELKHEDVSIVNFMNTLIDTGVMMGASDIHIEPFEKEIIIRYRIDGILHEIASLPSALLDPIVARLKVLSSMRIDEHRIPQDGRLLHQTDYETIDIRLSMVPAFWGEKSVMRLLVKETNLFDINSVGLIDADVALIRGHLEKPYGMMLVCGPTGSGKTTTLYSFLQEIGFNKMDIVNISTIEDPIEYSIYKINQLQVNPSIDFSFSSGLRALLRQDPDILMVGEIRDPETAQIAVRSALIGRLLLSSLHTNDSVGALPRLLDMGVEPYLISSTVTLVVAQRLVRKLCPFCRESYRPDENMLNEIWALEDKDYVIKTLQSAGILGKGEDPLSQVMFFKSKGCERCNHSGYQGRTGVFEILEVTDELREHINSKTDLAAMNKFAKESGSFKTLFVDGIGKTIMGITDMDEVLRVTL